jgi:hypothetical protein
MDAVFAWIGIALLGLMLLWALVIAFSPGGTQRYHDERRRGRRRR